MTTTEHNNKVIQEFATMMISRMEQLKGGQWKQGWFTNGFTAGIPMNLSGRKYTMGNVLMLMMDCQLRNFEVPVYCTMKQINDLGGRVRKGSKSVPAIFYRLSIKDANGNAVLEEDYKQMSYEEKKKCQVRPIMHSYNVFNIEQTNLADVAEGIVSKAKAKFAVDRVYDETGMYKNASIDKMLREQSWLCPIHCQHESASAYWSVAKDEITMPMKAQFRMGKTEDEIYTDGQEFYSTLIHEMAHSTSVASRLNRQLDLSDRKNLAREELVAELTAALVGYSMGFSSSVIDNNAMYLDSWIATLREEPKAIMGIMRDVSKASALIAEHINTGELPDGGSSPDKYEKWEELKAKHPEALLLFRSGDVYMTYKEDALKTQDVLGIETAVVDGVQCSSFPFHALDTYLPKLIRSGFRVAICDELVQSEK